MKMLWQAITLWKSERRKKGTTLQRRLILFFMSSTAALILCFALLLMVFGINGREETALLNYFDTELTGIAEAISDDFGRLSVDGINLAESISRRSDEFFREHGICAEELQAHPELIMPLLNEHATELIDITGYRSCGGAFMLLDATVNPDGENAEHSRAGIFIKKTQPTSTQAVGVKLHYLRGPADIARHNGIQLLGQWKMEFDTGGQDFFHNVMETARNNPGLPLSRLYYWTGRVTLKDNSEAGFLLCVPLRCEDGTVFGLCGIEVSDRMFKSLYSPTTGRYENAFAVAVPAEDGSLLASNGLIAGNYYLTGSRMESDLTFFDNEKGFLIFRSHESIYGGRVQSLRLYPAGSPYEEQQWAAAVLMDQDALKAAVAGNSLYLVLIVAGLLIISIIASVVISRHYLKPVTEAFDRVRSSAYHESDPAPYLEINDFLEFLAQKDRENEEKLQELDRRHKHARSEADKAQSELSRIADKKMREIDPDSFALFLKNLKTLTRKEREVFDLYLEGKSAKEIVELMGFTDNALKFHNKNLYSKLGVTSRKELLLYAALMEQEKRRDDTLR
ncbi:MAG: hypothetical protein IJB30_04665 [Clostridia bacterium]|nr:hypothetical protein [Clostridia bacterium]